mmetsp:Transcript_19552/g.16722  ORF Transcript_19552/g.16722 Transcript_19552/m.16722 type:complete len:118 (-) Transcript_19552:179-532(-)
MMGQMMNVTTSSSSSWLPKGNGRIVKSDAVLYEQLNDDLVPLAKLGIMHNHQTFDIVLKIAFVASLKNFLEETMSESLNTEHRVGALVVTCTSSSSSSTSIAAAHMVLLVAMLDVQK